MMLRTSRFVHRLPLGPERVLVVHAVSQLRLVVDSAVDAVLDCFSTSRRWPDDEAALAGILDDPATRRGCVRTLCERGLLTEMSADAELADVQTKLGAKACQVLFRRL